MFLGFQRKRDLVSQLKELAHRLTSNPSPVLENKQREVWHQYECVLFQEEVLWYQKSIAKWLQFGDHNTRFFHGTTVVRRRKNKYDILEDDEGNWVGDQDQLKAMVTNYFNTLFTEEGNREPACISGALPPLGEEDKIMLGRDASTS